MTEKSIYTSELYRRAFSYNPENDKNSQYNDKDGIVHITDLNIINTPVGTGVDKIYVQYTYENE